MRGFTLLEILISLVILAVSVVAILGLFASTLAGSSDAENTTIAMNLAQRRMEEMRNLDFDTGIDDEDKEDVIRMHDSVDEYIKMINAAVRTGTGDIITKAHSQGDEITHMMKEARARHLDRVEKTSISALCSLACSDMLTAYRRIKDHMLNIAEVLSGEK